VVSTTILTVSVPQADLIAMRHGYVMTADRSDEAPQWTHVLFTPASKEPR
jgi:hypothetical protein